mgnify:FL=1
MLKISSTVREHLVSLAMGGCNKLDILISLKIVCREIAEFHKFNPKKIEPDNQTHINLSCLAQDYLRQLEEGSSVVKLLCTQ